MPQNTAIGNVGIPLEDQFGYPQYTATTYSTNGATTLVASPGAGVAICVDGIRVTLITDTAGEMESMFRAASLTAASVTAASSNPMYRTLYSQTQTTVSLSIEINPPWVLDTITALLFVNSLSAASTGGVAVEIRYRTLTR